MEGFEWNSARTLRIGFSISGANCRKPPHHQAVDIRIKISIPCRESHKPVVCHPGRDLYVPPSVDGGCGWGGVAGGPSADLSTHPPRLPGAGHMGPAHGGRQFPLPPPSIVARRGKEGTKSVNNFFQTSDVQQTKVHCYGRDAKNEKVTHKKVGWKGLQQLMFNAS